MAKGLKSTLCRLERAGKYLQLALEQLAPGQVPKLWADPESEAFNILGKIEPLRDGIRTLLGDANRIRMSAASLDGRNVLAPLGHKPSSGRKRNKSARCTALT